MSKKLLSTLYVKYTDCDKKKATTVFICGNTSLKALIEVFSKSV